MAKSILGTTKKRGRPKTTGPGLQIGMRWQEPIIAAIDAWAVRQKDKPTRAEAIRRLTEIGLDADPKQGKKPRRIGSSENR